MIEPVSVFVGPHSSSIVIRIGGVNYYHSQDSLRATDARNGLSPDDLHRIGYNEIPIFWGRRVENRRYNLECQIGQRRNGY